MVTPAGHEFAIEAFDAPRGARVLAVAGELDLYTAPQLRTALDRELDGGARALVLDLTATTFMDSTALGVLIAALKALEPSGGRLVVATSRPSIVKTLAITGLDRAVAVEPGRADAIDRIAG